MKLYRTHVLMSNGCFSTGYYHPSKEFLIGNAQIEVDRSGLEKVDFFVEETELNLTRHSVTRSEYAPEPQKGPETGNKNPETPGSQKTEPGSQPTN